MLLVVYNIAMHVGAIFLGLVFVLLPYIIFSIGRKFDKQFRHCLVYYDPDMFLYSRLLRAQNYAFLIVLGEIYMRNKSFNALYGGYDFRQAATKLQKVISYVYFFIGVALIFTMIFVGINWILLKLF